MSDKSAAEIVKGRLTSGSVCGSVPPKWSWPTEFGPIAAEFIGDKFGKKATIDKFSGVLGPGHTEEEARAIFRTVTELSVLQQALAFRFVSKRRVFLADSIRKASYA